MSKYLGSVVPLLLMMLLLSVSADSVRADDKDQVDIERLGKQLVVALRDDNPIAFAQCWISASVASAQLAKLVEEGRVPESELDQLPDEGMVWEYFTKRDKKIQEVFPVWREKLLDTNSDLSALKIESIEAQVRERNGLKKVNEFKIVVRLDTEATMSFRVDDGVKVGDHWYFSDKTRE